MNLLYIEPAVPGPRTDNVDISVTTTSGGKALEEARRRAWDAVILDGSLKDPQVQGMVRTLRAESHAIILVQGHGEPQQLARWLEAGAHGLIEPQADIAAIQTALDTIREQRVELPTPVVTALVARMQELAEQRRRTANGHDALVNPADALSDREYQVFLLLRQDLTNQEIAERLTLQVGTVKNHVHGILKKLHFTNRVQAAQYPFE